MHELTTDFSPSRPDLHCHSTVSDGTCSPAGLAVRAKEQGVDLWALTDHDEVAGIAEAAEHAQRLGVAFLPGAEVSVTWQEKTIHIVALGVDADNPALVESLRRNRMGRAERAQAMAHKLDKLGVPNVWQGVQRYVGNLELISRAHLARYLVNSGVCRSMNEVFEMYLGDGKAAFVPHRWASLEEALHRIHSAGGMAVVAHPARYNLPPEQENAFFDAFTALGGQAVEVATGAHSAQETARYADLAQKRNLYASCGSDFHSPQESRCNLGAIPALPSGLVPVWQALADRIKRPSSKNAINA